MLVENVVRTEFVHGKWKNRWYTIVKLYGAEKWDLDGLLKLLKVLNIEDFILYSNRLEIPKYIASDMLEKMLKEYEAVRIPKIKKRKSKKPYVVIE